MRLISAGRCGWENNKSHDPALLAHFVLIERRQIRCTCWTCLSASQAQTRAEIWLCNERDVTSTQMTGFTCIWPPAENSYSNKHVVWLSNLEKRSTTFLTPSLLIPQRLKTHDGWLRFSECFFSDPSEECYWTGLQSFSMLVVIWALKLHIWLLMWRLKTLQ